MFIPMKNARLAYNAIAKKVEQMGSVPNRLVKPLQAKEITQEIVAERLSYRLRQMIGSGRVWTYQDVSERTLIEVRTLKSYVQGTACPNLAKYKRMLAVLGPEVASELDRMLGWLPRRSVSPPNCVDLGELKYELLRIRRLVCPTSDADEARQDGKSRPPRPAARARNFQYRDANERATLVKFVVPLQINQISTEAIAERFSYRFNRVLDEGSDWTVESIAEATGIDPRTIRRYAAGTRIPNLTKFYQIECAMGPLFMELALMIGWTPRFQKKSNVAYGSIEKFEYLLLDTIGHIDTIISEMNFEDGRFILNFEKIYALRYIRKTVNSHASRQKIWIECEKLLPPILPPIRGPVRAHPPCFSDFYPGKR
jgi:transcriptional regulator with XRE-family HTH domain